MSYTPATPQEVADDPTLADWRVHGSCLHAQFVARSFSEGGALVGAIARAADAADHHPDVDLRYPGRVHVMLTTHAIGGLSDADVSLARTVSQLASDHGAPPEPEDVQTSETATDDSSQDRTPPSS